MTAVYLHIKDNDSQHECRAYKDLDNPISSGKIILRSCIKSISVNGNYPGGGGIGLWINSTEAVKPYANSVGYVALNYDQNAGKINLGGKDDNGNNWGQGYAIDNPLGDFVVFELEVDYDNNVVTGRIIDQNGNVIWEKTDTTAKLPTQVGTVVVIGCGGVVNGDLYADWVKLYNDNNEVLNINFEDGTTNGFSLGLCANSSLDVKENANANECPDPEEGGGGGGNGGGGGGGGSTGEEVISSSIIAEQLTSSPGGGEGGGSGGGSSGGGGEEGATGACGINIGEILKIMLMASLFSKKEFDISKIIDIYLMCKMLSIINNLY